MTANHGGTRKEANTSCLVKETFKPPSSWVCPKRHVRMSKRLTVNVKSFALE
jgi:hypothetical protein